MYAPNSARSWINRIVPEYKDYSIVSKRKSLNKTAKYIVLAVETLSKYQKCLISDMKSKEVILIGSEFLTLECKNIDKPKLNSLDFVKVINLTETYPNYEKWLKNCGLNRTNWDQGNVPAIEEKYLLLFTAPKADFSPFDKENLCLIEGPYISNNGKYVPCENLNLYIVSEKALYDVNTTLEECCERRNL
ncbi:MAG: hypothetical protein ACI37Z_05100 [Candidatus Gastranaerophilaceae bacterium]